MGEAAALQPQQDPLICYAMLCYGMLRYDTKTCHRTAIIGECHTKEQCRQTKPQPRARLPTLGGAVSQDT